MNSKRPVNPSPARRLVAAVTASRFVLTVPLAVSKPFSTVFWLCYAFGMASDALDGPLARAIQKCHKLHNFHMYQDAQSYKKLDTSHVV